MSLKIHVDFECSSLNMIFHRQDILVSTRPWSLCQDNSDGHRCGILSKIVSQHVTFVRAPRFLNIS